READRFLERNHLAHAVVLDLLQLRVRYLSRLPGARRGEQALGSHEAPDMLHMEVRLHEYSPRRSFAPSTSAFILPNATSRGRYFMPQSGARITFSLGTKRSARFVRSTTSCGVSTVMSERSITPRMTFLP